MPKTTKRANTKRAARIAKAHATELPKLEVKEPAKRAPGYKPPKRGLARYPWGIFLSVLIIALGIYTLYFYHVGPFAPPSVKPKTTPVVKVCQAPAMTIDTKKIYCAGINTNRGLVVVELDPQLAPKTVNNFVFLAQHHFYDGLKFHRVVPKFIIQTGDPQGTGQGGPGYKFNDEPVLANYTAGCIAMANSGPNTNGSQFFICAADDTKALQKSYNLFGHVVKGMDVVLKIQGPGDTSNSKNIKPDVIDHVIVVAAS